MLQHAVSIQGQHTSILFQEIQRLKPFDNFVTPKSRCSIAEVFHLLHFLCTDIHTNIIGYANEIILDNKIGDKRDGQY